MGFRGAGTGSRGAVVRRLGRSVPCATERARARPGERSQSAGWPRPRGGLRLPDRRQGPAGRVGPRRYGHHRSPCPGDTAAGSGRKRTHRIIAYSFSFVRAPPPAVHYLFTASESGRLAPLRPLAGTTVAMATANLASDSNNSAAR
jgi:hypothetical protein